MSMQTNSYEETVGSAEEIVMFLEPGEPSKVLTCAEACEQMANVCERYEEYECIEDFMDLGLHLYCPTDQILHLGDQVFLTGPAVVCWEDEDLNMLSLPGRDIYRVSRYAEANTVTLCGDGTEFPALLLEG